MTRRQAVAVHVDGPHQRPQLVTLRERGHRRGGSHQQRRLCHSRARVVGQDIARHGEEPGTARSPEINTTPADQTFGVIAR